MMTHAKEMADKETHRMEENEIKETIELVHHSLVILVLLNQVEIMHWDRAINVLTIQMQDAVTTIKETNTKETMLMTMEETTAIAQWHQQREQWKQ